MSEPMILIVDDEEMIRDSVAATLEQLGMKAHSAPDGETALGMVQDTEYEVAIVDLNMPGLSGMETSRRMKEISPDTEIIIFTGHPSLETSIEAIHEAVFDYLCKPVLTNQLARALKRARERRRLLLENRNLLDQLEGERNTLRKQVTSAKRALERQLSESPVFVGVSEHINEVRRLIAEVAHDDITVLIRGESGTGKGVVARLIHEFSGRNKTGDFVPINCPAIPETLLESELFGHEAGAFTGAVRRKPGRFELAVGGTIFLDEIGEIPANLQAKLLQVIEHKQFNRLGGGKMILVDARILGATNAPLEEMIKSQRFRADLFYRLDEYAIEILPLRQRPEDIPVLANHFLKVNAAKHDRPDLRISPESMEQLVRHGWPGNVRELETIIRRYTLSGREEVLRPSPNGAASDISTAPITPVPPTNAASPTEAANPPAAADLSAATSPFEEANPPDTLHDAEVQTILTALNENRWNQRKAAQTLGISYSSLRRRIAKYDLKNRR